jgi:hypothetical protein
MSGDTPSQVQGEDLLHCDINFYHSVIPAKAGIQNFWIVRSSLDDDKNLCHRTVGVSKV